MRNFHLFINISIFFCSILAAFVLTSCATTLPPAQTSKYHPEKLLEYACSPGTQVSAVSGSVWLKADSKEVSGQFPTDVKAEAPDRMKLEINNILGGTEATVTVQGNHYEIIRGSGSDGNKREGYGSWGGIPLVWATELFLGKLPCPNLQKKWKMSINKEGELVAETDGSDATALERFIYRFKEYSGSPWADSLHWERLGNSRVAIDFQFEDPDPVTKSPKKWEAISVQGKIRVRWRDKEVVTFQPNAHR